MLTYYLNAPLYGATAHSRQQINIKTIILLACFLISYVRPSKLEYDNQIICTSQKFQLISDHLNQWVPGGTDRTEGMARISGINQMGP